MKIPVAVAVAWALIGALVEIQAFVRVFALKEPFAKVLQFMGENPSPQQQQFAFCFIGTLAVVRIIFATNPASALYAEANAFVHFVEAPIMAACILWYANTKDQLVVGLGVVVVIQSIFFYVYAKQLNPVATALSRSRSVAARSVSTVSVAGSESSEPTPVKKRASSAKGKKAATPKKSATPKRSTSRKTK